MPTEPSATDQPGSVDGGAPDRWAVWRQDDNGNRFEVARKDSRADAEELAAVMEARGHKQLYWVARRLGSIPRPDCSPEIGAAPPFLMTWRAGCTPSLPRALGAALRGVADRRRFETLVGQGTPGAPHASSRRANPAAGSSALQCPALPPANRSIAEPCPLSTVFTSALRALSAANELIESFVEYVDWVLGSTCADRDRDTRWLK